MVKAPAIGSKRTPPSKEAAAAVAAAGAAVVGGKLVWDRLSGRDGEDPRAYRLHEDEPIPDGIRRIARGQLDSAIEHLQRPMDGTLGEAVHETRKGLKRLRACLRLARPAIGDDVYARENETFREAGRRLSAARDAQVLIETLDGLTDRYREELPPQATARLRAELVRDHDRAVESLRANEGATASVAEDLTAARERTVAWTFDADGFDAVGPGLRRVYRRGRRSMRAAAKAPSDENLHEWRKRAKDLWHAAQVLRPAAPKRVRRFASRAHDLSDLLGEDHDLAVLRHYVETHPHHFQEGAARVALEGAIDRRREGLQQQAFELGHKLYEQKPKRFVRSVKRRWRKRAPQQAAAGGAMLS